MLTAFSMILLALGVLAVAALPLAARPGGPRLVHAGCASATIGFVLVALWALLAGGAPAQPLPFGPPWAPLTLALDPLSAWFLLLLGMVALPACLFAMQHEGAGPVRRVAPLPLFLAAMALTLAAADGFTLLLGFEAMSLASWVLVAADHKDAAARLAARLYLRFAMFGALCLVLALGLLAGSAGELGFAALRAAPPEGLRAALVLALVLAGAGSKAGLVPLHMWLPLAHAAAPSHVSALMSGAMTKVALYVLARLLFDLCGPAQPLWWAAPVLALGAASALLGSLRAVLETDSKTILACSTIENIGLITLGLGLAAAFRAADLGALAALAAAAALLHALNHGVFKGGLFLAAGTVLHGAGSRALDRLGGLVHAMPVTTACALLGAASAASLPPLSGFAGEWLLLQALLAGWQVSGLAFQLGLAAVVALAALSVALAAAAMVRFFGLVFLGRPRSARAMGAHEPAGLAGQAALLLPAGLTVLFGLFPGVLLALAEPALRLLVRHTGALPGVLALAPPGGATAYLPLATALLLGLLGGLLAWQVKRRAPLEPARGAAWACGFIAPPPHLPLGDPLVQPSAAGFAQPLRRMLGETLLTAREEVTMPEPPDTAPARLTSDFADPFFALLLAPLATARDAMAARVETLRGLTIRQCLSLAFGTLVLLLVMLALLGAG